MQTSGFGTSLIRQLDFLKSTKTLDDLLAKSVQTAENESAFNLSPLCELHKNQSPDFTSELKSLLGHAALTDLSSDLQQQLTTKASDFFKQGSSSLGVLITDQLNRPQMVMALHVDAKNNSADILGTSLLNAPASARFPEALKKFADWMSGDFFVHRLNYKASTRNPTIETMVKESGFVDEGKGLYFRPYASGKSFGQILTAGPSVGPQENSFTLKASKYGWNDRWNEYIDQFEKEFAKYVGCQYALSTASCTGALHLSLLALDIKPGDEVIVPEITWVATASAIRYVGATPVFVDIEEDSWCLDPKQLEKAITKKTKVIIPVHLYGHPANMPEIMSIAKKHGLRVIEDAAPSIGAQCTGQRTGSFGDYGAFSFQGAKLLVTGEGGMIVTNDKELYDKVKTIWDHGRRPGTFWIEQLGYKYKMSNMQAAFGLGQLKRCDELVDAKRRIFSWYEEELGDFAPVTLNREKSWARSIYWMSSIVLNKDARLNREELCAKLKKDGIDTRPVFPAISQYPMWKTDPKPVAKWVGDRGINLPSGVRLNIDQVKFVARKIKEHLQ